MRKMYVKTSAEYLASVLEDWKEFCRTHKGIESAIREVLEENKLLKERLSSLERG